MDESIPKESAPGKPSEGTSPEPRTADAQPVAAEGEAQPGVDRGPVEKTRDTGRAEPQLIKPATTRWKASHSNSSAMRVSDRDFARMSRRELLKVLPVIALGAFAIPRFQDVLLSQGLKFSDWASARLFRSHHMAPTFSDAELTPFDKFPINDYDVDDPGVIFETWTLTVSGAVQKPGDYTMAQIQSLPRTRQNTRHVCVEGWDVIGRFGGARLCDFLQMIGADTSAKFISVHCADDYYESLDMATALHPQTLLCWEMYDRPLTREHGAPLRLNLPTKIGYWEDQGYSEFYGL